MRLKTVRVLKSIAGTVTSDIFVGITKTDGAVYICC